MRQKQMCALVPDDEAKYSWKVTVRYVIHFPLYRFVALKAKIAVVEITVDCL